MKEYIKEFLHVAGMALTLSFAMLFSSCNDKTVEFPVSENEEVQLEISVDGVRASRSLVTGTTLPDDCRFSVFYNSSYGVGVNYANGVCTLDTPIKINQNGPDTLVYAVYPEVGYITEVFVDSKNQIDYLRGIGVGSDGSPAYPTVNNPKVGIRFDHILARITVNFRMDNKFDGFGEYFLLSNVYLGGNRENSFRSGVYRLDTGEFYELDYGDFADIQGEFKDGNNRLDTPEDVVTVDFLVIPSETDWVVYVYGSGVFLNKTKYEPGKQYIYNCTIDRYMQLDIERVDIQPWTNTDMPEVKPY